MIFNIWGTKRYKYQIPPPQHQSYHVYFAVCNQDCNTNIYSKNTEWLPAKRTLIFVSSSNTVEEIVTVFAINLFCFCEILRQCKISQPTKETGRCALMSLDCHMIKIDWFPPSSCHVIIVGIEADNNSGLSRTVSFVGCSRTAGNI